MKKIIALVLALVMVFALAACGGGPSAPAAEAPAEEAPAAEAPAAEAPAAEAPAAEAPAAEGWRAVHERPVAAAQVGQQPVAVPPFDAGVLPRHHLRDIQKLDVRVLLPPHDIPVRSQGKP